MKIALLKYSNSTNIGDNIQTLAVDQHIDQDYDLVDRDFLNEYEGERVVVVMNGWFTHLPQNWPPAPAIVPLFFGFHMSPRTFTPFERHVAYFRKFAPIGCRDKATAEKLKSWGVEAYLSGCATMTFPERRKEPDQPQFFLVDQPHKHFLSRERKGHVSITHELQPYMSTSVKFQAARDLLEFYRDRAGLVVTSRIHCAMPCAAMGIPAVYSGVREDRTAVVDMIGIQTIKTRRFPRTRLADLRRDRPNFSEVKQRVTADLHQRLASFGISVKIPAVI